MQIARSQTIITGAECTNHGGKRMGIKDTRMNLNPVCDCSPSPKGLTPCSRKMLTVTAPQ